MVFVQTSNFFSFFFGRKEVCKDYFLILWIEKNGFLDQKIELLKSAKHWHFPKGIVHGFCPNIKFFLVYIFWEKTSQERLFDILDRKEWFLDQKIEVLKGSKNDIFLRGLSMTIT